MPSNANDWDLLDSAAKTVRSRLTPASPLYGLLNDTASQTGSGMNPILNLSPSRLEGTGIRMPYTRRLFQTAEMVHPQIGEMPPQPPTLRGRLGAVLVRIVQRMLFWYTGQIRAFHKAVSEAAGEQANVVEQLDTEQRRQLVLLSTTVERLSAFERQLTDNEARALEGRSALADRVNTLAKEVSATVERLSAFERQLTDDEARALEGQTALTDRLNTLTDGLNTLIKEVSAPRKGPSAVHDRLFVEHAESFRGDREDIKSRMNVYVPYAKEAFVAAACAPALDLGCGRGEWLELLHDAGIPAAGIDWNRDLVNENRERGLDTIEGEILQILPTLPDESRSLITAFHVLEHLTFPDLLEMIDHTARILKPGGIALFETPNPRNLFVSTNSFYLDPTHQHPLPNEFLAFVVKARGLCDPKVIPLSPFPDDFRLRQSDCQAVNFINEHFFGPQDYGILAHKE